MTDIVSAALATGFANAAVIDTAELVYVPEYRKYCEENLCGNYNRLPVCPPLCGAPDEMHERMLQYSKCLVLQTEFIPQQKTMDEYLRGKKLHNLLTERLISENSLEDILVMSAGPWKTNSCMSAYSIDAEAMAKSCGMVCWGQDEIIRFFSSILFN